MINYLKDVFMSLILTITSTYHSLIRFLTISYLNKKLKILDYYYSCYNELIN